MRTRKLTSEQMAARDERRAAFRRIAATVAKMTDAQRAELLPKFGAVPTCEGRVLSLRNTLLCVLQRADVSMVGGFRQWLRVGRCVRKGEHGFMIWFPLGKGEDGAEPADGETEAIRRAFGTSTVFDILQTDPLPADGKERVA